MKRQAQHPARRRRLMSTVTAVALAATVLTGGVASGTTNSTTSGATSAAEPYHEKTAVYTANTEGHTCYRIPAVVKAANGDLLAFAEGRVASCGDRGDIDLVMKRSTDGGRTWGPLQVVSSGDGDTHGNPMPVVDERSGRIVLLSTHNPGTGSGGRMPHMQISDDDGATWSAPREMTELIRPEWNLWYATGPVHAIQLQRGPHAGRLVMSANHEGPGPDGQRVAGVVLGYSDDGGETWQQGADAGGATPDVFPNESTLVELTDGRIYVNVRESGTSYGTRAYAVSSDSGETFDAPFQMLPDLVMPVTQGSLLRLTATDEGDARDRLLFAGPANPGKREALTIRSSFDEAQTWQPWEEGKVISWGPGGYSDMVDLGDDPVQGTVAGILYEGGETALYEVIDFVRFNEPYLETPNGTPPGAVPTPPEPGPTTPDAAPLHDNAAYVRNGAALAEGRFGQGLSFDGTDDNVEVPYNGDLDLGDGDFTIMTSFRYDATSGQHSLWWMYQWGTGAAQIWLRAYPASNRLQAVVGTGQGDANITIPGAYNDGLWHHVALRRTNDRIQVVIDGTTVADQPAPRGSVTTGKEFGISDIILGQRIDQTNVDVLQGTLDEFRIYARAVPDKELEAIRTTNAPIAGRLLLRLPFSSIDPQ